MLESSSLKTKLSDREKKNAEKITNRCTCPPELRAREPGQLAERRMLGVVGAASELYVMRLLSAGFTGRGNTMRHFLFAVLFIVSAEVLFAQANLLDKQFYLGEAGPGLMFQANQVVFEDYEHKTKELFAVQYEAADGAVLAKVANVSSDQYFNLSKGTGSAQWLVLNSDNILLLVYGKGQSKPVNFTISGKSPRVGSGHHFAASSFLSEHGISYDINNIASLELGKMWAVRTKNSGIGEWFTVDVRDSDGYTTSQGYKLVIAGFWIVNGSLSINNPQLFLQNNRVKGFTVTSAEMNEKFTLEDNMNLQFFGLAKPVEQIKIAIDSIYKGAKYNDTCISKFITQVDIIKK